MCVCVVLGITNPQIKENKGKCEAEYLLVPYVQYEK